ncbi:hypothetical protein PIB30_094333, partial [Stylosanthes scabra]|nr:hypothetical protein [Stylosanthes scabra]
LGKERKRKKEKPSAFKPSSSFSQTQPNLRREPQPLLIPKLCHALFTTIGAPSVVAPSSRLFTGKQSPMQPPSVIAAPSVAAPSIS